DMTRLESGALEPHLDLIDLGDVVGSALRRASQVLSKHEVEIDLGTDLPMPKLDPVLFEQVLFNLLDNAGKYAPPGSKIQLKAGAHGDLIRVDVADEGSGIPETDLDKVFDKFYRVRAGDKQRAGTGLGLAICRGFIEAMGGTIVAKNRSDKSGAVFSITLPLT